jgi:hypothetical protein
LHTGCFPPEHQYVAVNKIYCFRVPVTVCALNLCNGSTACSYNGDTPARRRSFCAELCTGYAVFRRRWRSSRELLQRRSRETGRWVFARARKARFSRRTPQRIASAGWIA